MSFRHRHNTLAESQSNCRLPLWAGAFCLQCKTCATPPAKHPPGLFLGLPGRQKLLLTSDAALSICRQAQQAGGSLCSSQVWAQ